MAYKFQSGQSNLSGALEQQGAAAITGVLTLSKDLLPEEDAGADIGSSSKEWKDLYIDGVAYIDTLNADALGANLDCANYDMDNVDINSGAIDGTVIGAASQAAGSFTTVSGSGNFSVGGNLTALGNILPDGDNVSDLGSSTREFKDLYLDGVAYLDSAQIGTLGAELDANSQNIIGIADLGVDGNATFGNAATDKVNFVADISSSLTPSNDNAFKIGGPSDRWAEAHIVVAHLDQLGQALDANTQAITNVNIDSGNIDGTAIGAASQSTIKATTISGSGNFSVGGSLTTLGNILPAGDNLVDIGASGTEFKDLYIDGVAYLDSIDLAGTAITADATEISLLDAGVAIGAAVALVDTDGIIIEDDNTMKKVQMQSIKTYIGGGSVAVTSGSANFTGSVGINHFGDVGAAVECRMPALVSVGESIIFKAGKDCSTTNTITIKMSGSGKADGLAEVVLESPYAAVELACITADTTFIIL